jgi:hypothetical protein
MRSSVDLPRMCEYRNRCNTIKSIMPATLPGRKPPCVACSSEHSQFVVCSSEHSRSPFGPVGHGMGRHPSTFHSNPPRRASHPPPRRHRKRRRMGHRDLPATEARLPRRTPRTPEDTERKMEQRVDFSSAFLTGQSHAGKRPVASGVIERRSKSAGKSQAPPEAGRPSPQKQKPRPGSTIRPTNPHPKP